MNRPELTCKAKTLDGEWVEGYYVKARGYSVMSQEEFVHMLDYWDKDGYQKEVVIDSNTVSRCTGIEDENGKLIYEDDRVIYSGVEYVIMWDPNGCWVFDGNGSMNGLTFMDESKQCKIIGNIHGK